MAIVQIVEGMCGRFNIVRICTRGNYTQNRSITCHDLWFVLSSFYILLLCYQSFHNMRNTDSQLFWPLTKLPQVLSTSHDQAVPVFKMLGKII
jgi:hypothetical protein